MDAMALRQVEVISKEIPFQDNFYYYASFEDDFDDVFGVEAPTCGGNYRALELEEDEDSTAERVVGRYVPLTSEEIGTLIDFDEFAPVDVEEYVTVPDKEGSFVGSEIGTGRRPSQEFSLVGSPKTDFPKFSVPEVTKYLSPGKNPVSSLTEICMSYSLKLSFVEVCPDSIAKSTSLNQFNVIARIEGLGDFPLGQGRSRKQAKAVAARRALLVLMTRPSQRNDATNKTPHGSFVVSPTRVTESLMGVNAARESAGVYFDSFGRRLSTSRFSTVDATNREETVGSTSSPNPPTNLNYRSGKWTFLEQMLEESGDGTGDASIVQLKRLCKYHGWAWSLDVVPKMTEEEFAGPSSFVCTVVVRGSILCREEAASRCASVKSAVAESVARLLNFLCPEDDEVKTTQAFFEEASLRPSPRVIARPSVLELSTGCEIRNIIGNLGAETRQTCFREVAPKLLLGPCFAVTLSRIGRAFEGGSAAEMAGRKTTHPIVIVAFSKENESSASSLGLKLAPLSLVRRSLIRFLLSEVEKFHEGNPSVLWQDNSTELFSLKSNFSIDLILFPGSGKRSAESSSLGLERAAKLEGWRRVGVQGSVLSHIFKPIFFQSVVQSDLRLDPYSSVDGDASFAFVWNKSGIEETFDLAKDKQIDRPEGCDSAATSALCESAILAAFKEVLLQNDYTKYKLLFFEKAAEYGCFRKRFRREAKAGCGRTYAELKSMAVDYRSLKEKIREIAN